MSRRSVRDRVTLAAAGALAAGLAILTTAAMLLLSSRLDADASSLLRTRADAVLATLDTGAGRIDVGEPPNDRALDRDAWVFDASGRAVERAPASAAAQRAARELALAGRGERTVGQVRLRAVPITRHGSRRALGTVVAGISLVPYGHTRRIALLGMVVLDLFVLLGGALIARRAVGVALRPVAAMTAQADDWSEHDLERRFGLGPPRDELTALSATLDALLARIAASTRHEQRLAAEVAHELKTPLSGLRGEAELALRDGTTEQEMRAALAVAVRSTERMAAVIDTLLAAARGEAGHARGSSDPEEGLAAAAEALRPAATARGVALELTAPGRPLAVGADADTVAQALQPLLDNALRHAAARVAVSVAERGGEVVFRVRDDGPGVEPAARGRLFEPGASGGDGAGLGLPLARRLARACGGEVEDVPCAAGACFELRLPATGIARAAPASR